MLDKYHLHRAAVAVVAVNLVVRPLAYRLNYRGISLFCGDSTTYWYMAQGILNGGACASPDRPAGFPFFLAALLRVNDSPTFLLSISTTLQIAAQLLCLRVLTPRFVSPGLAAALALVLFCDPVAVKLGSMVFMADTLAVFLLCSALALLLPRDPALDFGPLRMALGMLTLGSLAR
jgi:hypothetical protein